MPRDTYKSERHCALEATYPSACNQSCNQGRMCDCVPNVDEVPNTKRVPWDWDGLAIAALICFGCFGFVFYGPMVQSWFV